MCGVAFRLLPFHQVLFGAEAFSRPRVVPYCRLSLLFASRHLCSLGMAADGAQCVGEAGWEGCTGAVEQWVGVLDAQEGSGIYEGPELGHSWALQAACCVPVAWSRGQVLPLEPVWGEIKELGVWAVVPLRMRTFLQ